MTKRCSNTSKVATGHDAARSGKLKFFKKGKRCCNGDNTDSAVGESKSGSLLSGCDKSVP
ncbi:hypothetical protein [Arsenophonus endosymbiont of Crataerina pallida]|uniref:hypothetical protein n=1 Tax=Arsenophonus endosymbiont of Crataerina pallida TaxID=3066235 RepID=UPI0030D3091C